ncbi:MAG TPA: GAF domain-containing sensor histidine kinase, partial [Anaerolineales bacterium]|nr:GAF domain-containing sensor histidine kinase [Anaerolineales bacterium]
MSAYNGPERRRDFPLMINRYERLLEVTRTLTSTLDLPSLLRNIIDAASELTETEAASILLFDANSGQLRFEATSNVATEQMEHITVPLEGSIAGTIFNSKRPLLIADATTDARHFRDVDLQTQFRTRSILGVPLINKDKTIGVLQALNKRNDQKFSVIDVTILETLAAQAAIAIINARLFQQSDLIAEMVHEIRTPLASLTATSHILVRADLPADRRTEFVTTLRDETNRLTKMTTEFLDLAKLESGRMRFEKLSFDLNELVHECVGVVIPQADTRRVAIHEATIGLPEVRGDRGKIKQVLLNLLTNAIKYNREGGSIYASGEVTDEGRMKVSVRDTGKGIPPESLPRIFEKFYRVPDSEGWSQGTGLGLAIAKRIIEGHGGKMSVESTVNVGTTFCFTLPLA